MAITSKDSHRDRARISPNLFADLRLRNARTARVAEMRMAERKRQVEQAIRAQRRRRSHQAR